MPRRAQGRNRWIRAATLAAALVAVLAGVMVSGWGGDRTATWISDIGSLVGAAIAAWACWTAARRRPDEHAAWLLLSIAAGLWALGEALWTYYELIRGDEVPFPSVADVAYLAAVPVAIAGLLRFTGSVAARSGRRIRMVLDGALVSGALVFVVWVMVLHSAWNDGSGSVLAQIVNVAYPVTDAVMATLAILVVRFGGARRSLPVRMLGLAFVLMAVADTGFTYFTNAESYTSANVIGVFWIASYLALALAAQAPDGEDELVEAASAVEPLSITLLPYAPFGVALFVAAGARVTGSSLDAFASAVAMLLVGVVLARQGIAVIDNRRLAVDLDATLATVNEQQRVLRYLAHHDGLTGLANRAQLTTNLEASLTDREAAPVVVYIDLDGFKQVNDRFGHGTGDHVLVEAAARLKACLDDGMQLARFGGDEFVLLTPSGLDSGCEVARRILDAFSVPFVIDGEVADVSASIGIAEAPSGHSPDEVIRRADAAMYTAKRSGRSRVVLFPDETLEVSAGGIEQG